MKFADAAAELEYDMLDSHTRQVAEEFDIWCLRHGMGQAIVTDIGRTPDWYRKNGLAVPAFSWHYVYCAIDFRNRHLTPLQRDMAEKWFRARCQDSTWEVVLKDHGTAPHFHIAYRSFAKRQAWQSKGGSK